MEGELREVALLEGPKQYAYVIMSVRRACVIGSGAFPSTGIVWLDQVLIAVPVATNRMPGTIRVHAIGRIEGCFIARPSQCGICAVENQSGWVINVYDA